MAEQVRVRTWVRASTAHQREGLLGWISIQVGPLVIDNITLRRSRNSRLTLSFPSRTAQNGARHAIVRPLDNATCKEVEREILRQLGEREVLGVAAGGQP